MEINARVQTVRIQVQDGAGVRRWVVCGGSARLVVEQDGMAVLTIPLLVSSIHLLADDKALVVARQVGAGDEAEGRAELQVNLTDVAQDRGFFEGVQSRLPPLLEKHVVLRYQPTVD